jgi:hypothetical protein
MLAHSDEWTAQSTYSGNVDNTHWWFLVALLCLPRLAYFALVSPFGGVQSILMHGGSFLLALTAATVALVDLVARGRTKPPATTPQPSGLVSENTPARSQLATRR